MLLKNKTEIISVLSARVPSLGDFELKLYNDRTRIGAMFHFWYDCLTRVWELVRKNLVGLIWLEIIKEKKAEHYYRHINRDASNKTYVCVCMYERCVGIRKSKFLSLPHWRTEIVCYYARDKKCEAILFFKKARKEDIS